MGANKSKLKEENKAIRARMHTAEEKSNKVNGLEATIQEIQQKMEEMAIQTEEQLKGQKQESEANNSKEMANLKELLKSQGINLEQMKSDISWMDLIKGKKVGSEFTTDNHWDKCEANAKISKDGFIAKNVTNKCRYVFAELEFCLSVEDCRKDNFSGIIIYYFEVTQMPSKPSDDCEICVGLSNGKIPDESCAYNCPNCYVLGSGAECCFFSGKMHKFKWPNGAIKPEWNGHGDVVGCGILMGPEPANKVFIFFTLNGILLGKKIPIDHPGESLYATVRICDAIVEGNFGIKPFRYDIDKCPGLEME